MNEASSVRQFVIFRIAGREYGLPITTVKFIVRSEQVTAIPFAEPYLEGMMNLRGTLLTVINGSRWLHRDLEKNDKPEKILVLQHLHKQAGFSADSVVGVHSAALTQLESPYGPQSELYAGFIRRSNAVIRILNIEAIFGLLNDKAHAAAVTHPITGVVAPQMPIDQENRLKKSNRGDMVLRFSIYGEKYGLDINQVRGIMAIPQIDPIAGLPQAILGVSMLENGGVLPIIDISQLIFGKSGTSLSRVICVEIQHGDRSFLAGIAVEMVWEVCRWEEGDTVDLPEALSSSSSFIMGASISGQKKPLFLVKIEQLLQLSGIGADCFAYAKQINAGHDEQSDTNRHASGADDKSKLYLFFCTDEEEFGIPADIVKEITRYVPVVPIPKASGEVSGIANIRGQLVTVMNVPSMLGLQKMVKPPKHLIVLHLQGSYKSLAVQQVTRVKYINQEQVRSIQMWKGSKNLEWLDGIYSSDRGDLLPLINTDKWISNS